MRRVALVLAILFGRAAVAWADPVEDLKACQGQVATLMQQAQQARQERTFYEVHLAELLAETRARLVDVSVQFEQARQDAMKARAKPEAPK